MIFVCVYKLYHLRIDIFQHPIPLTNIIIPNNTLVFILMNILIGRLTFPLFQLNYVG